MEQSIRQNSSRSERPLRNAAVRQFVVKDEQLLVISRADFDGSSNRERPRALALNASGSAVWDLCDGSHTTKDIAKEIINVLEADPSQVEGDVNKTIGEFHSKGLLEKVSK